jgi:hypothetical protein
VATSGKPGVHGGEVLVWDLATGREVLALAPAASLHGRVAFSGDGQRLSQLAFSEQSREVVLEDWDASPLADEAPRK